MITSFKVYKNHLLCLNNKSILSVYDIEDLTKIKSSNSVPKLQSLLGNE
jgi:hypothetical protein